MLQLFTKKPTLMSRNIIGIILILKKSRTSFSKVPKDPFENEIFPNSEKKVAF